jgi:hypothetical protein
MGDGNSKTKPYDKLMDFANGKITYFNIYNLDTGLLNWRLSVKEKIINLCLLENKQIILTLPLRYSHSSTDDKMVLKSKTWSDCVTLELYINNIHLQRLEQLNLPLSPILYGFLIYDGYKPTPIIL